MESFKDDDGIDTDDDGIDKDDDGIVKSTM